MSRILKTVLLGLILNLQLPSPTLAEDAGKKTLFHDFVKHNLLLEKTTHTGSSLLVDVISSRKDLKIIVTNENHPHFNKQQSLNFKDPSISDEALQFYFLQSKIMIQTVAFYLAPGAKLENYPNRPLKEFPLLVFKRNSPLHTIYHELGHVFIDEAYRNGDSLVPDNPDLFKLVQKSAEEVYVDQLLLSHVDDFEFDEDSICYRHKYLTQNNQILKHFLKQITPEVLNSKDLLIFKELKQLYSKSYGVQMRFHTQCFLFKYSS